MDEKVHVPVPPLESYWWLSQANIRLADETGALVEDYESGYPALLKALKRVLPDREVALTGVAVGLRSIFDSYYEISGQDPGHPLVSTSDLDEDLLRQALLSAWRQENPDAGEVTFEHVTATATYVKPGS